MVDSTALNFKEFESWSTVYSQFSCSYHCWVAKVAILQHVFEILIYWIKLELENEKRVSQIFPSSGEVIYSHDHIITGDSYHV